MRVTLRWLNLIIEALIWIMKLGSFIQRLRNIMPAAESSAVVGRNYYLPAVNGADACTKFYLGKVEIRCLSLHPV